MIFLIIKVYMNSSLAFLMLFICVPEFENNKSANKKREDNSAIYSLETKDYEILNPC